MTTPSDIKTSHEKTKPTSYAGAAGRRLRPQGARNSLRIAAAGLVLIAARAPAAAVDLPDDIWSGRYGGYPSVTVDAQGHVSIELPAKAVEQAGGGSVADVAKSFLETWGSATCFGIFDFQSPHKNLKVEVALLRAPERVVIAGVTGDFYRPSTYTDVEIDYDPKTTVKCDAPGT
jgi:hypothetical protein